MRIGIDLGGTKIEAIAMADDGKILFRTRHKTPQGDYPAILALLADMVRQVENAAGPARGVGVGTPGSMLPNTDLMQNCNSTCLNGKPFLSDLKTLISAPLRIKNDADCFVLSEARDGAAQGFRSVFGVILGTGVGGGYVVNGQLIEGPNALVGEWGHNPLCLPDPDRNCFCGRKNCVETWISGPAIEKEYHRLTGEALPLADIDANQSPAAIATIDQFLDRTALALGAIINSFDPDCIVFGGGVSNIDRIYTHLPRLLVQYILPDVCLTKIVKAEHGDSSGVRGAAWLWP